MPRFIQITTAMAEDGNSSLYGLTEDGQIWEYWAGMHQLIPFPGFGETQAMDVYCKFTPGWHRVTEEMAKPMELVSVRPPKGTIREFPKEDQARMGGRVFQCDGVQMPKPFEQEKKDFADWVEFTSNRGRK